MIKKFTYQNGEIDILEEKVLRKYEKPDEHSFAKRLLTGQAAEKFFEINYHEIPKFKNFHSENTTKRGCGFDFKLTNNKSDNFLGIEVKGLSESFGTISLTAKEYNVAGILKNREGEKSVLRKLRHKIINALIKLDEKGTNETVSTGFESAIEEQNGQDKSFI